MKIFGKLGEWITRERVVKMELDCSALVSHLQVLPSGVWGWFLLGPQSWHFLPDSTRAQVWRNTTNRWASLAGHAVKLRVTTLPFPAYKFAQRLDADTPSPLPAAPDAPASSWNAHLARQQQWVQRNRMDSAFPVIGVRIADATKAKVVREVREARDVNDLSPAAAQLLDKARSVAAKVARPGFNGRPLTAREMAMLMHKSVAMGMQPPTQSSESPEVWEDTDLYAFTDGVDWHTRPLGRTVRIDALRQGHVISRHVAVLTLGRMPATEFPGAREPWMLGAEAMPFPVEWAASGYLLRRSELTQIVDRERTRAEGIMENYREHRETPPPVVERAIQESVDQHDEITDGDPTMATRFSGPVRLAVYGSSEEQALKNAAHLTEEYLDRFGIEVQHPPGQAACLREFIPGEAWSQTGYQRRMPVAYMASGMPHVSSTVGTPTGSLFARTQGASQRPALWDGHFNQEVQNRPGVYPLIAEPGGGKSYLAGALAASEVKRGNPTIVNDPSGPLARLAELPELAEVSRVLNLTSAEPGTLAPWQLVREPVREDYEDAGRSDADVDRMLRRGLVRAAAERKQLAFDVFRMLLSSATLDDPHTGRVLRDVLREVGGGHDVNPRRVLTLLEASDDPHARYIVRELRDAAEDPDIQLIFPEDDEAPPVADATADHKLVVITMPGLVMPPEGSDRREWTIEALHAQPLLHLAAHFTSRFIYGRARQQRKNIVLDENQIMGTWSSGAALMVRLARDSRKWNTAVYPSSQHPDDAMGIPGLDALIGGAFVGRLQSDEVAERACNLLRLNSSYAQVLQSLSPPAEEGRPETARAGEFLLRDPLERLGRVQVDFGWWPELEKVLDTRPGPRRVETAAPSGAGHEAFVADLSVDQLDDVEGPSPETDMEEAA